MFLSHTLAVAHHQHPRRGELLLAPDAYRAELEVAAVSCEFLLGEHRVRKVFALFPGFANWQGAENVNNLLVSVRCLGIDYGTKRIGIAVSDPDGQFALPHAVIKNSASFFEEIVSIALANGVQTIVIGESRDYKGKDNAIMEHVLKLKKELEDKRFIVHLEPEFMTSVQAERFQGKNDKSDASAAALILQAYLDKRNA